MRLNERLFEVEQKWFVGRQTELELLHKQASGNWKWQWLHMYGQGGIGKSTLLGRFHSECKSIRSIYLDGARGIGRKEDVLVLLAEQLRETGECGLEETNPDHIAEQMNRLARHSNSGILLLVDAFEKWRPVEEWFSEWLRKVNADVRIVSMGRYPLTGGWLRGGWASLIYSYPLPALTPVEVEAYARQRGIADRDSHHYLVRFSNGIPLAMMLAAEVILRGGGSKRFETAEQARLVTLLMDELLQGLPASLHRLFEAAAVFWRFNEERLASVLDEEFDEAAFRELVRLPFVILQKDGWMLHDAVRAWSQHDLIRRKPRAVEQLRRKALQQIRKEERSNPHMRHMLGMDKLHLHEHPLIRSTCFSGQWDNVELRECRECDLPAIQSLYLRYLEFAAPAPKEERHLERLIRPVWQADSSSFITVWKQNELVAFYGMIPLQDGMLSVLQSEPMLERFLRSWSPIPNAFLSCYIGIQPELEGNARSLIVDALIQHYRAAEWLLTFTCLKEWFGVFELCGFVRAAWADAVTAAGTEYRAFELDVRQEDFLTKLDRLLTVRSAEDTLAKTEPARDIQELKQILREWADLPRSPALSETYRRLFPLRTVTGDSIEKSGRSIQQDLLETMNYLSKGDEREALWAKLLIYAYTQGIKPHERVAARLGLSMATYYRHLNKALERLYQLLSDES